MLSLGFRCLACVYAALIAGGCRELSQGVDYHGSRQLASGTYDLERIAWVHSPASVLALRGDGDGSTATLQLIALDGSGPCEMAAGTDFTVIFAASEEASRAPWRVAVLDASTGLVRLFGPGCREHASPIERVTGIRGVGERLLVQKSDASTVTVDPFTARESPITVDLANATLRSLPYREPDDTTVRGAAWLLDGPELTLFGSDARPLGPVFSGVVDFAVHRSPSFASSGLLLFEDAAGVALREVHPGAPVTGEDGLPGAAHLTEPAACEPRFAELGKPIDFPAGCGAAGCPDETPETLYGERLWVAMLSPCDDRRLVLRRAYVDERVEVASQVMDYRVLELPFEARPVVVYSQADAQGALAHYLSSGELRIRLQVAPELDSLGRAGLPWPSLAGTTTEPSPRYGVWDDEGVFTEVLRSVAPGSDGSLLLHDVDGTRGALAFCEGGQCTALADDVSHGAYQLYETVERIGDAHRVVTFIHRADTSFAGLASTSSSTVGAQAPGQLTAIDVEDGLRSDLDGDVTDFVPIEIGALRGILYTIGRGDRRGIWFAPR